MSRRVGRREWLLAMAAVGCGGSSRGAEQAVREQPPANRPYVVALGTAQDGGLPQLGCDRHGCGAARSDPRRRRLVSSILLCDPRSGRRWLFDASPDLREQVARAARHPRTWRPPEGRGPLFDAIFLTHGHVGHYTGLMHLGREAYGAEGQRVFGTARMRSFLRDNGPWSQLVTLGNVVLEPLEVDVPVTLGSDLRVTALPVPHRDEYTDTVAFVIASRERKLLYLPDIDKWERWDRPIEDVIASVDVALVDGTFFASDEVPGRAMSEIPHPFITESLERFAVLPTEERRKIVFTHLNHSNPAADPGSEARRLVEQAGMTVAEEGAVWSL